MQHEIMCHEKEKKKRFFHDRIIIEEVVRKHKIEYDNDKKKFMHGLWKDYKKSYPEDKIYVKNELNGFIHKGN